MAAWRKKALDAARHRQEKRQAKKVVIAHGRLEFCKATIIDLADKSKESLYRCETDRDTCAAPRHENASCNFVFFL